MWEITVTVDEPVILEAVKKAIVTSFAAPAYHQDHGGPGYEEVRRQVKTYINTLDLRDIIAEHAPAIVRDVTADLLATELRKVIKAQVKAMQHDGSLFQELQEAT